MAIGDNFGQLASQTLNWNNPNELAQQNLERTKIAAQAQQFQQQKQMQMMQMAMSAKQQQFAQSQWQAEQQQTQFENREKSAKLMLSAETPEGVDAVAATLGPTLDPNSVMAMRRAAMGFQAKQQQEQQEQRVTMLFEHNLSTTPPEGESQSVDLPSAPFGIPAPATSMMMTRPPNPIGQVGGQNVYRNPQQMNALQQSEIDKNLSIANKNNSAGGGVGQPSGNDAKNALWAKHVISLAKQNPNSVDPQTLEVAKQIDESSSLTPEATDLYADMAIQTGNLPGGFGMSKVRTVVMNKVGEAQKTLGIGAGDIIANGAALVANKGALNKLTAQKAQVDTFSDFTDRQLSTLGQTLNAVKDKLSGTPLFNKPIVSWAKNVQGDPEVQAYLQQLQSTQTEVARLVAGLAASGGAVPVTFEKEWENILSRQSSPAQVEAFIKQASVEKANRQKAFDKGQNDLLEKINKNPDPARAQKFLNQMNGQSGQEQTTDFPVTE